MSTTLGEKPSDVRVSEVDAFEASSFDPTVPLVVRGAAERARHRWTDEWLLEELGDGLCQVSLDSRPAQQTFRRHVPLRGYMAALGRTDAAARPRGYLFHSDWNVDGAAYLLADLDVPQAILELGTPQLYRFFMGPAESGTLPHVHTHGLNALARGRKHWAIYVGHDPEATRALLEEAGEAYGSGARAGDWFERELPALRTREDVHLAEFAQEPGDLVFIPAFCIHAVLNLEDVMGFTVELRPDDAAQATATPDP